MTKKPSNGHKHANDSARRRRDRVLAIMRKLPETLAVPHGSHLSLEVRTKRFGWFLDDHHGDGRVALHLKSDQRKRMILQKCAPQMVHIPKHIGHHGWIGLWLDSFDTNWPIVERAMVEAYTMKAPKSLAAQLE